VQIVQDLGVDSTLATIDLSRTDDPDARLEWLANELMQQPIDLRHVPLWRGIVATLGPERYRLLIVAAHVLVDGASVDLLATELARAMSNAPPGDEVTQYGRYARHDASASSGPQHEMWWRGQYERRRPLRSRWGAEPASLLTCPLGDLTPEWGALVRARNEQRYSVRPTTTLAVVVAAALTSESTAQAIGIASSNRLAPWARVIGPVFDHRPVVVDIAPEVSYAEAIAMANEARKAERVHRLPTHRLEEIAGSASAYDVALNLDPFRPAKPIAIQSPHGQVIVAARPI